jgi:hypothetical protein
MLLLEICYDARSHESKTFLSTQTAYIEGSRTPSISSINKVTRLSFNFHPLVTSMVFH